MSETPILGVIGGTGLTNFTGLENPEVIDLDTPYGKPSAPVVLGAIDGRKVAFLARHGIGHHIMPAEVNYRANIYALKSLGVTQVVGISACGSLREDYAPGHVVIPDQVVDFTKNRARSFFGNGLVAHIGSADPFCPHLSKLAFQAISTTTPHAHKGGTAITIEGPRFSTKAESNLFRSWGMSIIGMTTAPEVFLAREAELCYTSIAHVTDYDVWHTEEEPVTVEMIIQILNQNVSIIQESIRTLVSLLSDECDCTCESALEKAIVTDPSRVSLATRQSLRWLVGKYLK